VADRWRRAPCEDLRDARRAQHHADSWPAPVGSSGADPRDATGLDDSTRLWVGTRRETCEGHYPRDRRQGSEFSAHLKEDAPLLVEARDALDRSRPKVVVCSRRGSADPTEP